MYRNKIKKKLKAREGPANLLSLFIKYAKFVALSMPSRCSLKLPSRSQMTSKCGKNKKVAHEPLDECVSDVLIAF